MNRFIVACIQKAHILKASIMSLHIPLLLFPTACKFEPSCSVYAVEAIEKYGIIRGGFKSARRILKCSWGATPGYDAP